MYNKTMIQQGVKLYMYNSDSLSDLIKRAQGSRSLNQFARACDIDSGNLSRIVNNKNSNPPKPETLKKIADHAENNVTYEALMIAAGHFTSINFLYENFDSSAFEIARESFWESFKNNPAELNLLINTLYKFNVFDYDEDSIMQWFDNLSPYERLYFGGISTSRLEDGAPSLFSVSPGAAVNKLITSYSANINKTSAGLDDKGNFDITKQVEEMINNIEKAERVEFYGQEADDEDKKLLTRALTRALEDIKMISRVKYNLKETKK